jgi:hypothetical protein
MGDKSQGKIGVLEYWSVGKEDGEGISPVEMTVACSDNYVGDFEGPAVATGSFYMINQARRTVKLSLCFFDAREKLDTNKRELPFT